MARETILVVDDEREILELVKYNLSKEGFTAVCVETGEEALSAARVKMPDVLLLDLMLPGIDGLEVCRKLKADEKTRGIPIIMLTAKGGEADIVAGLELGATDYVTKPFSPRVLIARIKAVLRRNGDESDESASIRIGDMMIHPGRHQVLVEERPVSLTASEFRILVFMARKPGWVFTRQQMIDAARGHTAVTDRSVDVHIVGLRKKIAPCGDCIETVRGVGYRFKE